MGALVEIGSAAPIGRSPELEDHLFRETDVVRQGFVSPTRLWEVLQETSGDTIDAIFGPELLRSGERAFVPKGRGHASLGCLRPRGPVRLVAAEREGALRLRVLLSDEALNLGLTDARFYKPSDYAQIDPSRFEAARLALETDADVLVGVGLTRPFTPDPGEPERHWLQVNALHIRPHIGWRLAR